MEVTLKTDEGEIFLTSSIRKMGGTYLQLRDPTGVASADLGDHEVRRLIRFLEALTGRLS